MTGMEPFFIAAAATAGAAGSISAARAQSRAAKHNAAVAERNAQLTRQQTGLKENELRRKAALQQGALRAAYGSSGVTMEGTPLDIFEQSIWNLEQDVQTLHQNADLTAQGHLSDSRFYRSQSRRARTGGYLNAASDILMGVSSAYDKGLFKKSTGKLNG